MVLPLPEIVPGFGAAKSETFRASFLRRGLPRLQGGALTPRRILSNLGNLIASVGTALAAVDVAFVQFGNGRNVDFVNVVFVLEDTRRLADQIVVRRAAGVGCVFDFVEVVVVLETGHLSLCQRAALSPSWIPLRVFEP